MMTNQFTLRSVSNIHQNPTFAEAIFHKTVLNILQLKLYYYYMFKYRFRL